jgi:hypothetical protein
MSRIFNLSDDVIKVAKEKDIILAILRDDTPESPRAWSNMGKMICFHKRYDLGDKHDYDMKDYNSWDDLYEAIRKNEDAIIIIPLFLYDHSGITISTHPFSSNFDSGQIGYIYATKKDAKEEWPIEYIVGEAERRATNVLESEVQIYDQYLRGDVYGFVLEKTDGTQIDSCWGFYGNDFEKNGLKEHLGEYAHMLKDLKTPKEVENNV